jgi:hypothetical protein
MQFNDTSGKSGLIQQCEINIFGDSPFAQISSNSSRLAIFTNYLNEALSRYASIALMSDYNWEWDDRNQTDLPIGTTTLVSGQRDYSLSTEHAIVTAVEVKDTAGNWYALEEIDERNFTQNDNSISQYTANGSGTPTGYRKVANSLLLYPTASYTQAASLRVHFKRAPSYYTTADTTKTQGFTELHATYLSDYATWKYSLLHPKKDSARLRDEITIWEESKIPNFYSKRSAEHSKILRAKVSSSR